MLFLVFIILVSCNPLENKLEGSWAVDQAYYNDEPVIWDLYSNVIILHENNTCDLPMIDWEDRHTSKEKGTWNVYKKEGKPYLNINTPNKIFNRTFEIYNLREVRDSVSWGYLMKMTLAADSLKMDCTKALYK